MFDDANLVIPPWGGDCGGVIGPNGSGKSTLMKIIAGGAETADKGGQVRIGETVKLAYADQSRALNPSDTVYEAITGGAEYLLLGQVTVNARAYCASFNFTGSDQQKLVSELSGGGERNRVHLARTLSTEANVLLLDEQQTTWM